MTFRNGLDSLLRPEDSVLVLIDHQPYQLANLNSHDPHAVVNNSTALAKAAKAFGVPTILTTVMADRGGLLFPQITDVFPGQEVIDRTFINTWEDKKGGGRGQGDGPQAADHCRPVDRDLRRHAGDPGPRRRLGCHGHHRRVGRHVGRGPRGGHPAHDRGRRVMMTWLALAAEWQRDWARTEHAAELTDVLKQHAAGSGIAFLWEQQLLNTPVPGNAG